MIGRAKFSFSLAVPSGWDNHALGGVPKIEGGQKRRGVRKIEGGSVLIAGE
jgi:hypothetical protein